MRKINDTTPLNVFMADSATPSTGKTGITSPSVYYIKPGGSATQLSTPTWSEISSGSMPGWYKLTPSAEMIDTAGDLGFIVSASGAETFNGLIQLDTNLVSDVYSLVDTLETTLSNGVLLAATQTNYAPAKAGDAMTLTSAYDAAKTAATQTSVDAIPTAVENATEIWNTSVRTLSSGGNREIVSGVWNEDISNKTLYPNNVQTAAKKLRTVAANIIATNTAVSGTSNTLTLAVADAGDAGSYDPGQVYIIAGNCIGQTRNILQYDYNTRTIIVDRNWKNEVPNATSEYVIIGDAGREHVNEGLCRAIVPGDNVDATVSVKLNASASDIANNYIGQRIFIRSGTGEDQARRISAYDATTKIATVTRAWGVQPDDTSAYVMLPQGAITDDCIASAVWDAQASGYDASTSGSFGREMELIRMVLTNHQVDDGTTITIHDDEDSVIGTWTWTPTTGTRTKLTGS